MKNYDFKNDLTNSIFKLMGRILVIAIIVQIIIALINFVISAAILPGFTEFSQNLKNVIDPNAKNLESIIEDVTRALERNGYTNEKLAIYGILSTIIGFVSYNVIFNGIKKEVSSSDNSIGSALKGFLDLRLLHYFLYSVILTVIIYVLTYLLGQIPTIGFVIVLVVLFPMYLWFTSVGFGAIGVNNHNLVDAFKISMYNMTASRIAKTLGIGLVVFIVLVITGFVLSLLASMISNVPRIGGVLAVVLNSLLTAVVVSFVSAGGAGLYYRYTENTTGEDEFIITD